MRRLLCFVLFFVLGKHSHTPSWNRSQCDASLYLRTCPTGSTENSNETIFQHTLKLRVKQRQHCRSLRTIYKLPHTRPECQLFVNVKSVSADPAGRTPADNKNSKWWSDFVTMLNWKCCCKPLGSTDSHEDQLFMSWTDSTDNYMWQQWMSSMLLNCRYCISSPFSQCLNSYDLDLEI